MALAHSALASVAAQPAPPSGTRVANRGAGLISYAGRERQLTVELPRLEADVAIDGNLTDTPWAQAAVLSGFSQYAPTDGRSAEDSTEVLVWYSPTAIYFGVRAYAVTGTVRATLADRDKIYSDDWVAILLDTFHDRRQAFSFAVNPLGVQGDGMLLDNASNGTGGFGGTQQGRPLIDPSPDFLFQSKGRLTEFGYEIEVRIPLKSLKYQSADPQTWGLNVIRRVQSRGHEDSWAPVTRAAATYLGQFGTLAGLTGLRGARVLDVTPVVTSRVVGGVDADGSYAYEAQRPDVGANVRWGVTSNFTLNGTINPDFAEVESDATQFQADPRYALSYPEKRPFFLDGIEQFDTPNSLIYTRRIVSPDVAAKFTGKIAGTTIAVLSALDDRIASASGSARPVYNLVRVQRDFGTSSRAGLVYTDKIDGARSNRVGGMDARLVFGGVYSASGQLAASRTSTPGAPPVTAPLWRVAFARNGRTVTTRYVLQGIDRDFQAASGFIPRAGVTSGTAEHVVTWYGHSGRPVESVSQGVVLNGSWRYSDFAQAREAQDRKLHFNTNVALRGGWKVGASALVESFGFDPEFYGGYAIERHSAAGIDTVPFTGTPHIPNLDWLVQVTTPQFKHAGATVFYLWGHDENFYEWSSAAITLFNATLDLYPTDKVRLNATYDFQAFDRRTDGSRVAESRIPRVKLEYQLARPLFVRVVGEYDATFQDSLRDDSRTGDPLLVGGPDAYVLAGRVRDNRVRADGLIAFQPSPGTVIFAGYGATMTEPDALRFRRLQRRSDGVFVKMSYLFRR